MVVLSVMGLLIISAIAGSWIEQSESAGSEKLSPEQVSAG